MSIFSAVSEPIAPEVTEEKPRLSTCKAMGYDVPELLQRHLDQDVDRFIDPKLLTQAKASTRDARRLAIYEGPEPVNSVDDLRKSFFKKTKNKQARKDYFRDLAKNEYWVEQSCRNLLEELDSNEDEVLQFEEIKPALDVILRRGAKLVMGFSWGLGLIVKREAKKIFKKMLEESDSEDGATLLNLMISVRQSLLFLSSQASQKECGVIANYFYECKKIDYAITRPDQIPDTSEFSA